MKIERQPSTGSMTRRRFISSAGAASAAAALSPLALSGHQWTGPHMGTPEGFGVFDCQPDGTFAFRYESHGWKA